MDATANPYASSSAPMPVAINRARVGIRFGLLFGSPFLFFAIAGLVALVFDDGDFPFESLPFVAFFLAIGYAHCVCGWWWAARAGRGLGAFLGHGVAMGAALTLMVFGIVYMALIAASGFRPQGMNGAGTVLATVTPVVSVWLMLMGALVRWRIRVLERRAAASVSSQ